MAATLKLEDLRKAWDARDPDILALVETISTQEDPEPLQPIRDDALTFERFLQSMRGWEYTRLTKEQQAHFRIEKLKKLAAPDAEVPLPDRLKLHEFLFELWNQPENIVARQLLLKLLQAIPLRYGLWKAIKKIYKEAEGRRDTEVICLLAARFDMAFAGGNGGHSVSGATLGYLVRRAWRYLRQTGIHLPAAYVDTAVEMLSHYVEAEYAWNPYYRSTWILNHILFHNSKKYGRSRWQFGNSKSNASDLKNRAYGDLWKRTPRPLFSLLERAKCDYVREFATSALKTDFKASLRDVEPEWVIRLVNVKSAAIDDFVIWILQNVPKFEQGAFRTLGLHETVLRLFDSTSAEAQKYAAEYARTHARDLPVEELLRLADSESDVVRKLARDLISERDPRKDIGLEAWGRLLESEKAHDFAEAAIKKNFGAAELTPEWFLARLTTDSWHAFKFASELLPKIHDMKKLGSNFFRDLLRGVDGLSYYVANRASQFALTALEKYDLETLDPEFLKWLLLNPQTTHKIGNWIDTNKLSAKRIGVDFLKLLAFHPDWEKSDWVKNFKETAGSWAKNLSYNEELGNRVNLWLADPRRFSPLDLNFEWLLKVVNRSEARYFDFASQTMSRLFVPSDFAPKAASAAAPVATATVDFNKASFLFTGKMATMIRDEAERQVKASNGTVAGSVTPKLHYLIIGDDGSPLFGQGTKGSKQTKAEELNGKGANIRIISETAFLQMLQGVQREASTDDVLGGCNRLWEMLLAPGPNDAPLSAFARVYLRNHHPEIFKKENDRDIDPGAEIPVTFLSLERFMPLFGETRKPLRDFALEIAKYEFARWNPSGDDLVHIAESPYADVKRFVEKVLLSESEKDKKFAIDPATLSASVVYRFVESGDVDTRNLGMQIISKVPKFRIPEELYRLSESPDRMVRAFVIRALWAAYRDRGLTEGWLPPVQTKSNIGVRAKKKPKTETQKTTTGVPKRPEQLPAGKVSLSDFLRRILFELPPGRPESKPVEEGEEKGVRIKPLPARRSKLDLIEVMRDLGLEDQDFGVGVLPLLEEFMLSKGPSEKAACLVAVTRLKHKYGIAR